MKVYYGLTNHSQIKRLPRKLDIMVSARMLMKMPTNSVIYQYLREFSSVMLDSGAFYAEDYQTGGDILVYPLLNWTSADVKNYLKAAGLPTSSLYKKYGVSGCYWCPFYQTSIYRKILRDLPTLYDEFIKWEEELGASVNGYIYLRDLKNEVVSV